MKKKELKNLAKKIAQAELTIQTSNDKQKIRQAELDIMDLTSHVHCLEDTIIIDEMVQDILGKALDK